jgi:dipeptidyl aminopeptidase/acylaminoacyl peptidase
VSRDIRHPNASPRGSRPSRDPYGLLPSGLPIAPILSMVGLLVVGILTVNLLNGQIPFLSGGGGGGGEGNPPAVVRTPTPSDVVVVPEDPRADIPGTIAYVKEGNIWLQSGKEAEQLTTGGRDAYPSFSPDGTFVYFVRTRPERGLWPAAGNDRYYTMEVPSLMRVPADGSVEPERLLDGKISSGSRSWFAWIRQPVVSPDGKTVALLTDLPDPTKSNVVLKLYDLETKALTAVDVPETVPLGHQDPEWRSDGRLLLYVRNDRDGARGTAAIWSYSFERARPRVLTNPGYLHPSYSRDSQWVAATRTSAFGTDIVILRSSDGSEVLRLTNDGSSWAPVWSPKGDAVAFLHTEGQVVDLRVISLEGSGPGWVPQEALNLTELSGLESASRPDWFIPASELPVPTPVPTVAPSASPAASPSGS